MKTKTASVVLFSILCGLACSTAFATRDEAIETKKSSAEACDAARGRAERRASSFCSGAQGGVKTYQEGRCSGKELSQGRFTATVMFDYTCKSSK